MYSSKVHTLSHYEYRDFEQRIGLDVVFASINLKYSHRHLKTKEKEKGYAVAQLDEALRCNPASRGFDSPRCHWNFFFFLTNPSGRSRAMVSAQPQTEMSAMGMTCGERWPVRRTEKLATFVPIVLKFWERQPPGSLRASPGMYTDSLKKERRNKKGEESQKSSLFWRFPGSSRSSFW